jgi:Uma2 family endonuclease
MASHPVQQLSVEQYLELERAATERHEYIDGEMVAMSGGTSHFRSRQKSAALVARRSTRM